MILAHYCSSYPKLIKGIRAGKPFYALELFTRSLPCFTELYTLYYPNGIKTIPKEIYNLLTPVALDHLIMVDGSAHPSGLIICTNSFSCQDVVTLLNVLIILYRLDCSITIEKQKNKIEYMKAGAVFRHFLAGQKF